MVSGTKARSAVWLTAGWVGTGVIGMLLDILTLKVAGDNFSLLTLAIFYLIPPLTAGFIIAVIDRRFLSPYLKKFVFWKAFLFRIAVYLFALIAVANMAVYMIVPEVSTSEFLWRSVKFVVFWSIASSVVLLTSNLLSHFEKQTIMNWLRGAFHHPQEQEKIFLFIDLKNSTAIAEALGSNKYFSFIKDFLSLVAESIEKHDGELYQHIGDEIVITWPVEKGVSHNNAIAVFVDMEEKLLNNTAYFMDTYGYVPYFKGSLHAGTVTSGEVGVLRKEFMYVGDVLNATARIQAICKKRDDTSLVISQGLLDRFVLPPSMVKIPIGQVHLRGKKEGLYLYGLGW
jgi:adenylate cyclase